MADLQTEIFRKVLPQMRLNELKFDDDVGTTTEIKVETEKETTNQTELLWRYIRDNPGSSASDVTNAKGITDYKNVATRINQLAKRGVLRQDTSDHPIKNYVVDKFYPRISKDEKLARMNAARATLLDKRARGEGKPKKVKKMGRPIGSGKPTPNSIIKAMSVLEARELYDQLKQIFGG
jgi:hypothetical protein